MRPDFTLLLCVDSNHLEQLVYSYPTWIKYKPELRTCPITIVWDADTLTQEDPRFKMFADRGVNFVRWAPPAGLYANNREKMLTAFVSASAEVRTPWYMKLDTDALALDSQPWIDESLFLPRDFKGRQVLPAYVASRWSYTKPAHAIGVLDDWADKHYAFAGTKRLNVPVALGAKRAWHRRMCSWIMFGGTEFAQYAASLCEKPQGYMKLPFPSQDTFVFYVAHRLGWPAATFAFKHRGWTNISRTSGLKEKAAQL